MIFTDLITQIIYSKGYKFWSYSLHSICIHFILIPTNTTDTINIIIKNCVLIKLGWSNQGWWDGQSK
jgi:hypothetical protein